MPLFSGEQLFFERPLTDDEKERLKAFVADQGWDYPEYSDHYDYPTNLEVMEDAGE